MRYEWYKNSLHLRSEYDTVQVVNFEGFKFSWISWLLAIHEMKHDNITAHGTHKNFQRSSKI